MPICRVAFYDFPFVLVRKDFRLENFPQMFAWFFWVLFCLLFSHRGTWGHFQNFRADNTFQYLSKLVQGYINWVYCLEWRNVPKVFISYGATKLVSWIIYENLLLSPTHSDVNVRNCYEIFPFISSVQHLWLQELIE